MATKYTEDDVKRICAVHGHKYVDGYTSADKTFNAICACGEPWIVFLCTVRRNHGCKYCTKVNKSTLKTLLEKYVQSMVIAMLVAI
jgi:hypothetical protein